ncbi:MAG: hypothetical protein KF729_22405 [Sandaracinaceae bacterium]|nr:hypothetical protein [Sandaracinaceae bacterium]
MDLSRLALVLVLGVALAPTSRAAACASCGCGDPTLTTIGVGQPFAGRARVSLALEGRWDELGEGTVMGEASARLAASYAFDDRVALAASVPLLLRDLTWASQRHVTTLGLGDADVRARVVLLRDRSFAPSHLFGVALGVKLPTSIDQVDAHGARLPVVAQSGSGTIDPLIGLTYSHFADPFALFASATVALPFAGRYEESPGPSLFLSVAAQHRFDGHFSVRLGTDARLDAPALIGARTDPRTRHFSLFTAADLLVSPITDWIFQLGASVPVLQDSPQGRTEGVYFRLAVTADIS